MPEEVPPAAPSPDARERITQLMEAELRLTREAISQQGHVLASINNTLIRFDITLAALGDFLHANTSQLAKIAERVADLEARVDALEKPNAA
jgi:hypothetical protein